MTDLDANINVRCSKETQKIVDEAAKEAGLTRTQWVLEAIEAQLRKRTQRSETVFHRITRDRMTVAGRTPASICVHPIALRTAVGPDGTARCMGCNSSIGVMT